MWNKINPPVLGLNTNIALAVAGGLILLGLLMLLWGRKIHVGFIILAAAGAGVLFLSPVVQRFTGLEQRPAQIIAGVSAGLVAGFGYQFVWALAAGAALVLASAVGALAYFHPDIPSQVEAMLPKAGTAAEPWALAMGNVFQLALSEAWKNNWGMMLLIACVPGLLGIVAGVLRTKATVIVLTPLLGALLAVGGALVAAEAQKSSLWTTAWSNPVVPGAVAGGLMLGGLVVQSIGRLKQLRAARAAEEKAQQQASPPAAR